MGLDISPQKVVTLTDAHERRLVTDAGGRCYNFSVGDSVIVECVFRRSLRGDAQDGIPLMYALKGTKGYKVESRSLLELQRRGFAIAARRFAPGSFDVVVPAPSSSGVPLCLARLAVGLLGPGAMLVEALRKRTIGAVLGSAPLPGTGPGGRQAKYRGALGRLRKLDPNLEIAVKALPSEVREYFRTVEAKPGTTLPSGLRFLVVDDSASTGSTLRDSALSLREAFGPVSVTGLALVGPQ
ncbi:hypothetical protein EAH89_15715 [Roseomonas nepalensis]|uniref:ComF family protein n=1 Tax=Muricoccus nepalensis TaxID=1854500 RepID=A0A502FXH7_9PROT|nr:hypothetical protein [Roseomonas nepalensis]TPG53653.1 hypothetical protein EAH89_15715 [Roseomonas nepalensis]